jgi:chromosomal replication initiator protein
MSEPVATWVLDRLAKTRGAIREIKPIPADEPFWRIQMREVRRAVTELEREARQEMKAEGAEPVFPAEPDHLTINAICAAVAEVWDYDLRLMTSPRRTNKLAIPRMMAYAACRQLRPDLSLPQIGRSFRRDHSTIINGCVKHKVRLADPAYAAKWQAVLAKLGAQS